MSTINIKCVLLHVIGKIELSFTLYFRCICVLTGLLMKERSKHCRKWQVCHLPSHSCQCINVQDVSNIRDIVEISLIML